MYPLQFFPAKGIFSSCIDSDSDTKTPESSSFNLAEPEEVLAHTSFYDHNRNCHQQSNPSKRHAVLCRFVLERPQPKPHRLNEYGITFLTSLLVAKVNGVVETRSMYLFRALATKPTTSIDDDIREFMDMIRDYPIFALSDTHGAFIQQWRELETLYENGLDQEDWEVWERLRKLEMAFMSEQGSLIVDP